MHGPPWNAMASGWTSKALCVHSHQAQAFPVRAHGPLSGAICSGIGSRGLRCVSDITGHCGSACPFSNSRATAGTARGGSRCFGTGGGRGASCPVRGVAGGGASVTGGSFGGGSDVRSRWLPDQPTYVVPPELLAAAEGSHLLPSDETWAKQRGVYMCYSKADLSYEEAAELAERAGLHFTREDFRNAAELVWAYRSTPAVPPSPPAAAATVAVAAAVAAGSRPEQQLPPGARCGGDGGGAAQSLQCQVIGFASADLALPPHPASPAAAAAAAQSRGLRAATGGGGGRGRRAAAGSGSRPSSGSGRTVSRGLLRRPPATHPAQTAAATAQSVTTAVPHAAGPHSAFTGTAAAAAAGAPAPDGRPPSPAAAAPDGGCVATVWHLAVAPALQRSGLGRALLLRLLAALAARWRVEAAARGHTGASHRGRAASGAWSGGGASPGAACDGSGVDVEDASGLDAPRPHAADGRGAAPRAVSRPTASAPSGSGGAECRSAVGPHDRGELTRPGNGAEREDGGGAGAGGGGGGTAPVAAALRVTLRATSRSAPFYDRLGLRRDASAPLVKGPPGRAVPLPLLPPS